ncbi:uncharacterized protein LOC141657843 [Silene latifolia]|uniref:uncharacterized protein LOC141657843 n=1 Tax=Silene latifolia TaxID=37657 RepID=UPI003D77D0DB
MWDMDGAMDGGEKDGGRPMMIDGGGRWERPREGWYKINVDAGVAEGMGTGLGVVCRDDSGSVQWGVTVQEAQVVSPEIAEALAVLQGIKEAKQAGISLAVIESDCGGVIEDLKINAYASNSEPSIDELKPQQSMPDLRENGDRVSD